MYSLRLTMCMALTFSVEALARVLELQLASSGSQTPAVWGPTGSQWPRVLRPLFSVWHSQWTKPTTALTPFIRLVPCITDPWARSVLLEIPWAKTSIQRERRAIICAFDCMSTLMLLMAGLDSNASPLAALDPPIIDDLIRQCDERRISRVYHALH